MSEETKRDVFEYYLDMIKALKDPLAAECVNEARQRYAAALPDDLPVIQEAVGDVIVKLKRKEFSLSGAMSYAAVVSLSAWMTFENENTFALAWLLGVWRVEETGEIVKLEAEVRDEN